MIRRRRVHQAGGVVVRRDAEGVRVLIVSSRRRRKRWVLPKGHVKPREAAATAALREVEEEAGITGVVLGPVRTVIRQGFTTLTSIDYFLIEYTGRSNDGDGRRLKWRNVDDAIGLLSARATRDVMRTARAMIVGPEPTRGQSR